MPLGHVHESLCKMLHEVIMVIAEQVTAHVVAT